MSIEAIRAEVGGARERINAAYQETQLARERLAEAVRVLTELSRGHTESLLPPQLAHADEQLAEGLAALAGSLDVMDRFVAGL
jgi:hypothetical protein